MSLFLCRLHSTLLGGSFSSRAIGVSYYRQLSFSSSSLKYMPRNDDSHADFTLTQDGLWIDRSLPRSFDKILIANRGEIACRVMRTARQLDIKTVAVYSDADAAAMHVQMADEAYRIGPPPSKESYLLGEKILEVAKHSGAQAIHPGYGFLSENEHFARQCEKANIVFIGPPASAIHAMGSKSASKNIMTNSGVPVVPGYHGEDQSMETLHKEAARVGYPIMIKAVLGGGGKGMRIVWSEDELKSSVEACIREAKSSFNDDRVLLERYIRRPRHIEFQVFADKHGNAVHLMERDCSVQRRHQKVLEEAPAPGMSSELRAKMGQSAVDAAKAVGYVGAGTVEFIFDAERNDYFFMEMNTRLQVEHCVSEMITRRDFVQWQLHVAAAHHLPATQEEILARVRGHAIEARVYAENPDNNFLPCTGKLYHLKAPSSLHSASGSVVSSQDSGLNLRVETGVRPGDSVSIYYDPMIAKLVVWGSDRNQALSRMSHALSQYEIVGLPTNIAFLQRAINHPVFKKGQVETGFIADNIKALLPSATDEKVPEYALALAVVALFARDKQTTHKQAAQTFDATSPWSHTSNFRLNASNTRNITLVSISTGKDKDGSVSDIVQQHQIRVAQSTSSPVANSDSYTFTIGTHEFHVDAQTTTTSGATYPATRSTAPPALHITARIADQSYNGTVVVHGSEVHVFVEGKQIKLSLPSVTFGAAGATGAGAVSPMAGRVVQVLVTPGTSVKRGQTLMIMEAMKMEHMIKAAHDGVVDQVLYQAGDFVEGSKLMVHFAASPNSADAKVETKA